LTNDHGDFQPPIDTLTSILIFPKMVKRSTSASLPHRRQRKSSVPLQVETIVWTTEIEKEHWLKVPKVLLRFGRYSSLMGNQLQPRHVLLILALAARKFRDAPIICSWTELARDLGVKRDTVRHWAYELKEHGLLRINNPKRRNEDEKLANTFEFDGFIDLVEDAFNQWKEQRN
jgi:hypothetical protein